MSRIKVDRITDKEGTGAPILVNGVNVTGKSTMGDVVGAAVTFNSVNSGGTITATGGFTGALTGNVTGNLTGDVTGDVTGSGANLTNLPSAQLTGALPAIDGSALTGIQAEPEFAGIASGSITGGRGVCVADDGKLMGVTGSNEAQGTSTSAASIVSTDFSIAYHAAADRYVIFYNDGADGSLGKARVGTQSGTTITWGSAQHWGGNSLYPQQISVIYDSTNEKIVCAYRDNTNNGRGAAIVGDISGDTLTLGTPVSDATDINSMEYSSFCYCPDVDRYALVYNDGATNKGWCRIGKYTGTNSVSWPNPKVKFLDQQARGTGCFFDSTADKLVIMYHDSNASNHGAVIAGTIANDTVTFGSSQWFDQNNADGSKYTGAHDSSTGKSVLCYGSQSYVGNCRTATLSGTTFTFGAAAAFGGASASNQSAIAYGAAPNKFLVTWADGGQSNQVKSTVTTLTGTTITYDTPYTFQTGANGDTGWSSLLYNPDNDSFIALYRSGNGPAYYVENIRVSNLTKGNYVGIANASYTDGQTASTALPGAVNTAVSGLTVGQKYYVVADGTLNTTADSEGIDAGNAIAANKLLVR